MCNKCSVLVAHWDITSLMPWEHGIPANLWCMIPGELKAGGLNLQVDTGWGSMATWKSHAFHLKQNFLWAQKEGVVSLGTPVTEHLAGWPNITESDLSVLEGRSLKSIVRRAMLPLNLLKNHFMPFLFCCVVTWHQTMLHDYGLPPVLT